MKSSTKFFIFFIFSAIFALFITFYPDVLTLLPFKIPYVASKIESILQWGSYVVTVQALFISIALKIRRQ